jgi:N-methylhydantoinase B
MATHIRNRVEGRWNLADSGRKAYPPWGLWNGKPGQPSEHLLRLPNDPDFKSVDVVRHWVPADSDAVVITAGGGGWGDPLDRDVERVREDVLEEYISTEAARNEYGVDIDTKTLEIDHKGTARLRGELRKGQRT